MGTRPSVETLTDQPERSSKGRSDARHDDRRAGRTHGLPRRAQPRPATGRRARRRSAAGPAPRHRRRRIGQDQHPGAPRRPPDPERRRSPPHPAADLLAPRRGRDGAPRRAYLPQGAGRQGRDDDRRADLGRDVPRHRRAAPARVRLRDRPRPRLHDPRPRGLRRPDEPGAQRPRVRQDRAALPDQGHLPLDLLAMRQRRGAARGGARAFVPVVRRVGRRAALDLRRLRRGQSRPRASSITTTCCSTGRRASPTRVSPPRSAAASTTSWSTSTRTPTACSPRSCWR